MLNKNQSHKRNSWKYAIVLPLLFVFMFYFQVKIIAQEKQGQDLIEKPVSNDFVTVVIDKNSSDEEMKNDAALLKKQYGISLKVSKVKRNSDGEITGIKVEYNSKDGNKGVSQVDGKEPIKPIHFYKNNDKIGFGTQREVMDFKHRDAESNLIDENDVMETTSADVENNDEDFPIPPTPPTPPTAPEIVFNTGTPPNFPTPPAAPSGSPITNEKEWGKFEKKMAEFEKKMEAMEPEIEAYALKMSNIDEQMKPFEKEMEAFEKTMEVFEKQMKVYEAKVEIYLKRKQKE